MKGNGVGGWVGGGGGGGGGWVNMGRVVPLIYHFFLLPSLWETALY